MVVPAISGMQSGGWVAPCFYWLTDMGQLHFSQLQLNYNYTQYFQLQLQLQSITLTSITITIIIQEFQLQLQLLFSNFVCSLVNVMPHSLHC